MIASPRWRNEVALTLIRTDPIWVLVSDMARIAALTRVTPTTSVGAVIHRPVSSAAAVATAAT